MEPQIIYSKPDELGKNLKRINKDGLIKRFKCPNCPITNTNKNDIIKHMSKCIQKSFNTGLNKDKC